MQYSSLARLLLLLHAGRRYNCAASFVLPPGPAVGRDSVGTAGTRNICEREDSVVVDRKEEEKPFVRRDFEKNSPMDVIRPQASLSSSFYGPMPFGLVVGHTDSKEALVLAASNPQLGGVVLYGGKGTGKSVLARSVHRLLPPTIQRIKDSRYNVDPCDEKGEIDSILQAHLLAKSKSLQDLETESIPTPFVTVPLNCQEDSFLGTVDLEQSMISGQTVFEPGLLARAHRGILYVDDINLLDDELVNILLNVIADGSVTIEREGLSVRYPCKPLLLASYNPAEGELREHLLDRIAMSVPADVLMSVKERVDVVINVEGFQDKSLSLDNALQEEDDIHQAIAAARILLPKIEMSHEQLLYICQEATRADCKGQRAEIFAAQIAKTSAALGGRMKVNAGDLQRGVLLAIVPRSKVPMTRTDDADSELQPQAATLPLPPPPDMIPSSDTEEKEDEEEQEEEDESQEEETPEENDSNKESEEEPDSNEESEEELAVPEEFMFGVDAASIDPRLLRFDNWTRKGKGGKRSRIFNLLRGRFVKAVFPKGEWKRGKIAIGGTLRAAAPFQKIRRAHAKDDKLVYIRDSDFRIKRMARKAGSLVIFVVDSSGSMALNRMGAAKGAAMSLLQEAYKSRDKICLISFHDERAEILVPPTKSSALTKRRLEGMPCGGGSPLAHGLVTAIRTGLNAIKVKKDVGRVVVVLLTDGRANVPLCVSEGEAFDASIMDRASTDDKPTRGFLKDEVLAVAKRLGSLKDFNLLCIDTEDRYVGTGFAKELSRVAQGNYHHMSTSNDREVTAIAKQGLEHARQAMAS